MDVVNENYLKYYNIGITFKNSMLAFWNAQQIIWNIKI